MVYIRLDYLKGDWNGVFIYKVTYGDRSYSFLLGEGCLLSGAQGCSSHSQQCYINQATGQY